MLLQLDGAFLSHVSEALLGPPNQPPSQQAAAVVVMVLHMTLTLDISFLLLPSLLAGGNRVRLCTTFLSLGDEWVGWWWVHIWLPPLKQAIGAESFRLPFRTWQAAKFVINQSAKHTVLSNKVFSSWLSDYIRDLMIATQNYWAYYRKPFSKFSFISSSQEKTDQIIATF